MSLVCIVVIGYFDPTSACRERRIAAIKPIDVEEITHLQTICQSLFDEEFHLHQYLTDDGFLWFPPMGSISRNAYQVIAVAREVFGMSAVDVAHRHEINLVDESSIWTIEKWAQYYRNLRTDWDDQRVKQEAERTYEWYFTWAQFQCEVQDRVRRFVKEGGCA